MTTSEFVEAVVLESEGKLPTFVSGHRKWLRIVAQGNLHLRRFARERGVDWNRFYNRAFALKEEDNDPILVTATDTFLLHSSIRKLSQIKGDTVRIVHTDGNYSDFTIVPHNQLKKYANGSYVAKVGSNLVFSSAFTADSPEFGGTIYVPMYRFPTVFEEDEDELDIDDPDWLVFTVAADRVKNDVTRKDLRSDLISEANEIMQGMKDDGLAQLEEVNTDWNPLFHLNDTAFGD